MRPIVVVTLDKRRPAVVLTRPFVRDRRGRVTVAPITSRIRGLSTEVSVGRRNGVDQDSVISCDNIATVGREDIGAQIGFLLPHQEAELATAIMVAFDLN